MYTCIRCSEKCTSESGELSEYDVRLEEVEYCTSCAKEKAYCPEHDGYSFEKADINSIEECQMCKECAEDHFSGPQSDDPDFWDSYDPN